MKKEMTLNEKIDYMRISCGICGFGLEEKHFDLLVSMYELVMSKKGNAKLDDMVEVKMQVDEREDARKREEARKEFERKTVSKDDEK